MTAARRPRVHAPATARARLDQPGYQERAGQAIAAVCARYPITTDGLAREGDTPLAREARAVAAVLLMEDVGLALDDAAAVLGVRPTCLGAARRWLERFLSNTPTTRTQALQQREVRANIARVRGDYERATLLDHRDGGWPARPPAPAPTIPRGPALPSNVPLKEGDAMPRLRVRQRPPDTPAPGVPDPPVCGMCGHRASFYVAGREGGPPLTVDLFTRHTRALACGRCRSRVLYHDRAD